MHCAFILHMFCGFMFCIKNTKENWEKKERKKIKVIFCFLLILNMFFLVFKCTRVFMYNFYLFVCSVYIHLHFKIYMRRSIHITVINLCKIFKFILISFRQRRKSTQCLQKKYWKILVNLGYSNTSLRIQLIWGTESILYIKWFSKRKIVVNFHDRVISSISYFKVGR